MKKFILALMMFCAIVSDGFAKETAKNKITSGSSEASSSNTGAIGFATVGTGLLAGFKPDGSPVGLYGGFALFNLNLSSFEEEFAVIGGNQTDRIIIKDGSYTYKIGVFSPMNFNSKIFFGIALNMRKANENGKIRLGDGRDELYVRNETSLKSVDIDFFVPFKMDFAKGQNLVFQFGLQLMPGNEDKINIDSFNGGTGKAKISNRGVGLTLSAGFMF
ncbi:MAG: hypothetical protein LBD94_02015 [Rickettsiales bacterium]|jgi:hypothetical protein|nr:hypothetical protein [Rickettsiales bacterium]